MGKELNSTGGLVAACERIGFVVHATASSSLDRRIDHVVSARNESRLKRRICRSISLIKLIRTPGAHKVQATPRRSWLILSCPHVHQKRTEGNDLLHEFPPFDRRDYPCACWMPQAGSCGGRVGLGEHAVGYRCEKPGEARRREFPKPEGPGPASSHMAARTTTWVGHSFAGPSGGG